MNDAAPNLAGLSFPKGTLSISVGLAYESGESIANRGQVLEADDLLYAAKHAGRNRVAYRDRAGTRLIEYCP